MSIHAVLPASPPNPARRRLVMAVPLLGMMAAGSPALASGAIRRASVAMMGTRVDIVADAASLPEAVVTAAIQASQQEMLRLARMASRYEPLSEASRINQRAGVEAVPVSKELFGILQAAHAVTAFTGGAFDVSVGALQDWRFDVADGAVPDARRIRQQLRQVRANALVLDASASTARLVEKGMAIDLGGIAKLPILEAGLRVLAQHGVANALVNGGGDVVVSGLLQGRPWRIGVRDPLHPAQLMGAVALMGGGVVASSGDYERCFWRDGRRMHHILNPRTGYPTQGVHGVAMVAAHVADVNGLGAAAMVKGLHGASGLFAQRASVQAIVVTSEERWSTAGMAQALRSEIAFRAGARGLEMVPLQSGQPSAA